MADNKRKFTRVQAALPSDLCVRTRLNDSRETLFRRRTFAFYGLAIACHMMMILRIMMAPDTRLHVSEDSYLAIAAMLFL